MWDWLANNSDQVTALVAVLGLVLATGISLVAIRASMRASHSEELDRQDKTLTEVLDRVVEFQHPAMLPYWKASPERPVDPESEAALNLHRAITSATSRIDSAGRLELAVVKSQLDDLELAARITYEFGCYESPAETRLRAQRIEHGSPTGQTGLVQPWNDAWAEVAGALRSRGISEDSLAGFRTVVADRYPDPEVGRLMLADACIDAAREVLIEAYKREVSRTL
jgi:hypothetical protein